MLSLVVQQTVSTELSNTQQETEARSVTISQRRGKLMASLKGLASLVSRVEGGTNEPREPTQARGCRSFSSREIWRWALLYETEADSFASGP